MDLFKKPVFLGLFVLAIICALIWSYLDNRKTQKAATENQAAQQAPNLVNLTNIDPTDFDSAINDGIATATAKAVSVNKLYKLAAVEYDLPAEMLPNVGNVRYVYTADTDTSNNWTVTFSMSSLSSIRALIPKEDYLGNLKPINNSVWKVNYIAALQIAEKNGGLDWREKNQQTGITLALQHLAPKNWLTWTVTYQSKDASFIKTVDAYSGKIIDENTTSGSQ